MRKIHRCFSSLSALQGGCNWRSGRKGFRRADISEKNIKKGYLFTRLILILEKEDKAIPHKAVRRSLRGIALNERTKIKWQRN